MADEKSNTLWTDEHDLRRLQEKKRRREDAEPHNNASVRRKARRIGNEHARLNAVSDAELKRIKKRAPAGFLSDESSSDQASSVADLKSDELVQVPQVQEAAATDKRPAAKNNAITETKPAVKQKAAHSSAKPKPTTPGPSQIETPEECKLRKQKQKKEQKKAKRRAKRQKAKEEGKRNGGKKSEAQGILADTKSSVVKDTDISGTGRELTRAQRTRKRKKQVRAARRLEDAAAG